LRILHLLNWKLSDIVGVLDEVANQGFQAIQINPLQPLKEDGFEHWWMSYQPCGFSIGNQYGSIAELKFLCDEAHKRGVLIFADVICTHVAGKNNGELEPHEKVDQELVSNPSFWREKRQISNWESRYEVVNYCAGLPSFNLENHELQDKIIGFLNEMIALGVDGFRFDSAKSIRTPREGGDFFPRVLGSLEREIYPYGEVIFAGEELISLYADYLDVLTNTWSSNRDHVVVFSESHDSYYEFGYTKNKTSREITNDYRNLVQHYPNTLYFARSFDNEWRSPEMKDAHTKGYGKVKIYKNVS